MVDRHWLTEILSPIVNIAIALGSIVLVGLMVFIVVALALTLVKRLIA